MLDIDERSQSTQLLGLRNEGQRQSSLTRAFRTEDLDDPAARKAADPKGPIDENVPRRNRLDVHLRRVAEPHDRAISILFHDLLKDQIEIALPSIRDGGFLGFG